MGVSTNIVNSSDFVIGAAEAIAVMIDEEWYENDWRLNLRLWLLCICDIYSALERHINHDRVTIYSGSMDGKPVYTHLISKDIT